MIFIRKKVDEPITAKQQEFIDNIMDFAEPPVPEFNGTTKKEASVYISRYANRINVNSWSITHGYY